MEMFDTIIIGSGAGGLSAALCLSRAGQKVLVLEQHYVPGGWCHNFYLNGQAFCPGVHYIGLVGPGESTNDLYSGLGIANELTFFRMNPKAYEHCHIGEHRIDMPAGFDNLVNHLGNLFPKEKKGIKEYLKIVRNVSRQIQMIPKMNGFWDNITIPYRTRHLGKYGLFSLKRVLGWYIKDPVLKNILNVQCGDHGLPPLQASFPLHCAVMDHYFEGGYYPMGGGASIVKAMTNVIKKNGGEIRTSKSVKRILIEGDKIKKAIGVELADGQQIMAKRIISNADPSKTYFDMIGAEHISQKLNEKLSKTKYSVASIMLFLTVDMDVKSAGLDSGNIWMLRDQNMDDLFAKMTASDIVTEDEFPALFLSCTTLKDPTSFNGRYHNIEVVTFIGHEPFKEFKNEGSARSEKYLAHKDRFIEKMMNSVAKILPGVRDHVVQMELGTPVTNEFYINATDGSVYGTSKTFNQSGPFSFKNKSEIENLYLAGASVLSHGVAGASASGVQTAALILGCRPEDLTANKEGQSLDVLEAEDSSNWPAWVHQKIAERKKGFKEIKVEPTAVTN